MFAPVKNPLGNTRTEIDIVPVTTSKVGTMDFNNLPFGKAFSDHMFIMDHKDGAWGKPQIKGYEPMTYHPGTKVFHYGQAIFEGMKAYRGADDSIYLFRPAQNISRLNKSAVRLNMPEVPEHIFMEGLHRLVDLDREFVKRGEGRSLYIRPFMIATEVGVAAATSTEYRFMIICSAAKAYYTGDLKVQIAQKYSRSADGGVGFAKAAGNYAASFYPTDLARKEGYQQIIWTDASSHEYLEEAGTMNVFFRVGDKLLTAPTNDRILDGVTRKSIVQLARDMDIDVEVRRVSVAEIVAAARAGELKEIFGTGTAAVISPIVAFSYDDEEFHVPKPDDAWSARFKQHLVALQSGDLPDPHGWRMLVEK